MDPQVLKLQCQRNNGKSSKLMFVKEADEAVQARDLDAADKAYKK